MEAPLIKLNKTFLLQLIDLEPLFCHFYLFSTLLWPEMKVLGTRKETECIQIYKKVSRDVTATNRIDQNCFYCK